MFLGNEMKCEVCGAFYHCFATDLINSITQGHESKILFISAYTVCICFTMQLNLMAKACDVFLSLGNV